MLDEMRRVQRKAWEFLSKTKSEGDHRGSIVALHEVRECLESLSEMLARADAANGVREQKNEWDYSLLSDEELRQVTDILEKAYIGPTDLQDRIAKR